MIGKLRQSHETSRICLPKQVLNNDNTNRPVNIKGGILTAPYSYTKCSGQLLTSKIGRTSFLKGELPDCLSNTKWSTLKMYTPKCCGKICLYSVKFCHSDWYNKKLSDQQLDGIWGTEITLGRRRPVVRRRDANESDTQNIGQR